MDASLTLNNDTFKGNSVGSASATTGFQLGGAIFNSDGVATITDSTFVNNQAIGSAGSGRRDPDQLWLDVDHHRKHVHENQAIGSYLAAGGAIFGDPAQ